MNCCEDHEGVVVVFSSDECPLCTAEEKIESLKEEVQDLKAELEESGESEEA